MIAYCMKCKKKINIKDGVKTKTKKGVPMIRGKCSICNTKVCVIGNK